MPKILDQTEIEELLKRMREIQNDERNLLAIRVIALKIETYLLQMDVILLEEEVKNNDKNL